MNRPRLNDDIDAVVCSDGAEVFADVAEFEHRTVWSLAFGLRSLVSVFGFLVGPYDFADNARNLEDPIEPRYAFSFGVSSFTIGRSLLTCSSVNSFRLKARRNQC
jgi:hypothetical protein